MRMLMPDSPPGALAGIRQLVQHAREVVTVAEQHASTRLSEAAHELAEVKQLRGAVEQNLADAEAMRDEQEAQGLLLAMEDTAEALRNALRRLRACLRHEDGPPAD